MTESAGQGLYKQDVSVAMGLEIIVHPFLHFGLEASLNGHLVDKMGNDTLNEVAPQSGFPTERCGRIQLQTSLCISTDPVPDRLGMLVPTFTAWISRRC